MLVATLIATAGVAYASIPTNGIIHGCYKTLEGKLRVIDPSNGDECAQSETALDWNQAGPTGPAGPQGPQGIQGVQGPTGPAAPGTAIIGGASDDYGVNDKIGMFTWGQN